MFAHPEPKHVALVGGGEGATLREILKHRTIESATMIELDEELVSICREHLPQMSNCSDLVGRAENCFDDDLANLVFVDGRQWFVDRFAQPEKIPAAENLFDVVIVDALDPEDSVEIAEDLYSDATFISSLMNSLSEEGVLVIQVGTAPNIHDPKPDIGVYSQREKLFNLFEDNPSVAAMLVYEEPHCGFAEPHSFVVMCRSVECRERWYSESDAVDYEIYDRILKTHSGERPLLHFDGSTQRSYHTPPKAWETVYCRREPTPFECAYRGLDMARELHDYVIDNEEAGSFHIEHDAENETSSVFALVDIPEGSYIMPEHLASSFIVSDKSLANLRRNTEIASDATLISDLLEFIDEHGHESNQDGLGLNYVEVGGTFMMRYAETEGEANVGRWVPSHPSGKRPVYSPVYERYRLSFDVFLVATKDIAKGEELLKYENLWSETD